MEYVYFKLYIYVSNFYEFSVWDSYNNHLDKIYTYHLLLAFHLL